MIDTKVVADYFWSLVNKLGGYPDFTDPLVLCRPEDGECWTWQGNVFQGNHANGGYGRIGIDGRTYRVHRVVFCFLDMTPPQPWQVVDHRCRNRLCCNPRHLEFVKPGINTLRGNGAAARNARKTHCKRGHELTPDNLIQRKGNTRQCKTCTRELAREKRKVS